MMTRSQGRLQAREPRANTRRRQIKLKTPIQPRSLSDSCSSAVCPVEPRKKRKVSADDPLYKEYSGIMSPFFTSGAGTSSSSVSVGGLKMSTEEQHASALKHLISNNIGGVILSEYSGILRFADVLEPFFYFEKLEGQISFLNSHLEARANGNLFWSL